MAQSLKPAIDFKTLSAAFANYDLGTLEGGYQQLEGDIDISYKITTNSGVYLLKFIENKKNTPQFEMLGELSEYLQKYEVPVPKVYKTKNNKYVENDFILYDFIEGEIKKDWSIEEITSLTTNFAKMLTAMKKFKVPDFVKNKNDKFTKGYDIKYCHDVIKPKIEQLSMNQEIKVQIIKVIDLLYAKLSDFEKIPKFLIHGDLNETNAIFKDGKNVGIIDFGVSYDPIVYDLGEFCYWFAMPWWTEEFNHERYNTITETFEKVLPLSIDERSLLPYMILRRGMMDLYLTLDWYWSNLGVVIPEKRLSLLNRRNDRVISEFNL
jgi:Ser/Thr protein kinase RdoA (MazF antagonist)